MNKRKSKLKKEIKMPEGRAKRKNSNCVYIYVCTRISHSFSCIKYALSLTISKILVNTTENHSLFSHTAKHKKKIPLYRRSVEIRA